MPKRLTTLLNPMMLSVLVMLIFAVSCAVATFIENDFGTQSAKAAVYNTRWFEALMVAGAVGLIVNMVKFRMFTHQKRHLALFHGAFLLILAGAALTRYAGYEGVMHIREGESENRTLSSDAYLIMKAKNKSGEAVLEKPLLLSKIGRNSLEETVTAGDKKISITLKQYIPNAIRTVVDDPKGIPMVSLVMASDDKNPQQKLIAMGDRLDVDGLSIAFLPQRSESDKSDMQIFVKDGIVHFLATREVGFVQMSDQLTGRFDAQEAIELKRGRMYMIGRTKIVPRVVTMSGKIELETLSSEGAMRSTDGEDGLILQISDGDKTVNSIVMGEPLSLGIETALQIGDSSLLLSYGSKVTTLPFSIKLHDFELQRYPGSMSPSSYKSSVEIVDEGLKKPYEIYMNHTLDHKGYRFFQSSYDQDEKGTVLSVSHDPGKLPTYLGYLLLGIGLFWTLLHPNGRFMRLNERLNALKNTTAATLMAAMLVANAMPLYADNKTQDASQAIMQLKQTDTEAAKIFGSLAVQDSGGRIKPVDSLARDILNKVSGSFGFLGLSPSEVLLGMTTKPKIWHNAAMIKVSHPQLLKLLGIDDRRAKASFSDMFEATPEGNVYKIAKQVEEVNRKKPSERDTLDKELLKVDERVNICYMVYSGKLLRLFAKPNDEKLEWLDPAGAITQFGPQESQQIRSMVGGLFNALENNDHATAVSKLLEIQSYQKSKAAALYPSQSKLTAELWYNKLNLFFWLIPLYLLCGAALAAALIMEISKPSKALSTAATALTVALIAGFALHTANLALRWYISGHAPWSDGFESMTYIAWASMAAGLIFRKKSAVTFALTAILASFVLFGANLSWMDPQITNIQPVLRSYWLILHVSMITASYGFLALGALLGLATLALFAYRNDERKSFDRLIAELVIIDEMALLFGLVLLTIGNFLGGVWANESWGRYWGWDAKETWALISIMVYAAVLHTRYIPKVQKSDYWFAVMSLFGFSTILMTYFGVNFYLSGLHSYAAGEAADVPWFVYVALLICIATAAAGYGKRRIA